MEYIRAYLRLHPLLAKDAELKRTWLTRLEQHFADALSAEDPTLYSGLSEVLTRHRKELKQTFNEINERVIARAAQWMRAVPRQSGDHRPVEQIIATTGDMLAALPVERQSVPLANLLMAAEEHPDVDRMVAQLAAVFDAGLARARSTDQVRAWEDVIESLTAGGAVQSLLPLCTYLMQSYAVDGAARELGSLVLKTAGAILARLPDDGLVYHALVAPAQPGLFRSRLCALAYSVTTDASARAARLRDFEDNCAACSDDDLEGILDDARIRESASLYLSVLTTLAVRLLAVPPPRLFGRADPLHQLFERYARDLQTYPRLYRPGQFLGLVRRAWEEQPDARLHRRLIEAFNRIDQPAIGVGVMEQELRLVRAATRLLANESADVSRDLQLMAEAGPSLLGASTPGLADDFLVLVQQLFRCSI